ncbi:hypothetical protein GCM10023190_25770 [Enteractinococcus fodinae]|uniref:Uncharacterized protein n=1 Tax=Enteractinococcus fodinae TaxID=684663 RepID=A0ABU2B4D8_9MICC|nr:DUF6350 family protein [Enteractinococcus fodinae]MDR7347658.1 hypothetical protein [Enteractinococcus fodinae]
MTTTTEPKSFPMPLWLQGIMEALAAAFISAGIIVVPLAIMWLTGAFAQMPLNDAGALGAYSWLASFGVPLELTSVETDELVGTWWFIPLGLFLGWLLLARRAGKRLAKASQLKTLWQPTLGAVAAFTFFVWGTNTLVTMDTVDLNPTLAVLLPSLVFTIGYVWGALGYFRHPIGEYLVQRVDRLSDSARNVWHYFWALLRAGVIGLAGAWAIAAILMTVQVGIHWAEVTDVYQRLDAGIFGGLVITILQILVLPNVVAWTISYLTGAGFQIGATEISPAGTLAEAQPAVPIFAAIPTEQSIDAHWWVLLLLALAGIVAGWWFFGVGENHLEDLIIAKIPNHPTAITLAVLATGATIGLTSGVLCLGVMWLANGSWAIGSLSVMGAPLWTSAGLFAAHIGIGAAIGYALAPLRHGVTFWRTATDD